MGDKSGIGDGVAVQVNDEVVQGGDFDSPDAKGPDPAVWGDASGPIPHDAVADAAAATYEAAGGGVKGPGDEWSEAARAERGAVPDPHPDVAVEPRPEPPAAEDDQPAG